KTIDRCKSIIDARVKPAHDVGEYFDNKSFRDGAAGPESRRRFTQRPSHAHACRGHDGATDPGSRPQRARE
ncbi:MAG: hypothetical protein WA716_16795, partial [Pseudolabrys sp.]